MTVTTPMNRPVAFRMLTVVASLARQPDVFIPYVPSNWFREKPTPRRRARWSRMLHRLAVAGMLQRQTDDSRDRVRRVAVTRSGWSWILENSGAGAFLSLEELLEMPGQGAGDLGRPVMVIS